MSGADSERDREQEGDGPLREVPPRDEEISERDAENGPLRPPSTSGSGGRIAALNAYRYQRKRQRKARKGYIQWYLIDGSTFPEPRFVKPKSKAGGIPELDHDGGTYLFPRESMAISEREGMLVAVHVKGESEPVNLSDPVRESIDAEVLDEYLTMRVTSSPPSLLDNIDIDPQTILYAAVGIVLLWAVFQQAAANGVF
jgi:hypothetical protein